MDGTEAPWGCRGGSAQGGLGVARLSSWPWGPVHKRVGSASCKAERNEKGQGRERGGTWCSPTFSPHQAANPLVPSSSSFFFLRLDPPPSLSTTRGQICINSTAAASINWAALGALLLGEPEVIPLPWREHPELDISGSNGKRSHSTPQSSEPGTNPLRRAELGRATAHTSSCWMLLRHDTL